MDVQWHLISCQHLSNEEGVTAVALNALEALFAFDSVLPVF